MQTLNLLIRTTDDTLKTSKEIVIGEKCSNDDFIMYTYKTELGNCSIYYHINTNHIEITRDEHKNKSIKFEIHENIHSNFYYNVDKFTTEFFLLGDSISYNHGKLIFNYAFYNNLGDLKGGKNRVNKICMSIEEIK